MTFASAILRGSEEFYEGDQQVRWGTFTSSDSGTGGNIDTGLTICEDIILQEGGDTVVADKTVLYETLPVAGSAVTIVSTANATGFWLAKGRMA